MKTWQRGILVAVLLVFTAVVSSVGYIVYFFNRPIVKIDIPMPKKVGEKSSTSFNLPKGSYVLMAHIGSYPQFPEKNAEPFVWRYRIEIPSQNLVVEDDAKMSFQLGPITYHLKKLQIEKNNSKCIVSTELIQANKSGAYIDVYLIEAILFRTVV